MNAVRKNYINLSFPRRGFGRFRTSLAISAVKILSRRALPFSTGLLTIDIRRGQNNLTGPDQRGVAATKADRLEVFWRGSEKVLTEIKIKKGEPVDKVLRRLKKKIDRE